jgi:hypothetical protein
MLARVRTSLPVIAKKFSKVLDIWNEVTDTVYRGNAMTNYERFQSALETAYNDLFESDPDFAYVKARKTPAELAAKMTAGLATGDANHDGIGIRRACKAVGSKATRTAIRAYLAEGR